MKKLIILALIILAVYFIYKNYVENSDSARAFKKNIRNVDLFQTRINDSVQ